MIAENLGGQRMKRALLLTTALLPVFSAAALAAMPRLTPIPRPMSTRAVGPQVTGSPWTPLANQPSFLANGASNPILLTDGTVLVQDQGSIDWWKLTPDSTGSYVNGTWSQIASLPSNYAPLYHSSAVLPDGRLIIEGGEYLNFVPTWTALGAIYNPLTNTWQSVAPPTFFGGFNPPTQNIGDAQSVVLPNGTYMQADCCTTDEALLDPKTLTWTRTGANKADENDEEGWTLLPNQQVLTVDAYVNSYLASGLSSELYTPTAGAWAGAGNTTAQLWDSAAKCGGANAASYEVGPAVLRPDGTVFATGANACAAGHTSVYNSHTGTWSAGPDFPNGEDIADGPAALEPNGKVLMMASPGIFASGSVFYEWNGKTLATVPPTPGAVGDTSYYGNMLVLPTGQILLTDFSNDVEIFTPTGAAPKAIKPVIARAPVHLVRGSTYKIAGYGFNGVSQGAAYGDDVQAATNYPLIRMTSLATHHVFYSRTHDHSSMAVASRALVATSFDVPAAQETGTFALEVVANGIASAPTMVSVQ
jgi:hypothetical protein